MGREEIGIWVILGLALLSAAILYFVKPIPQDPRYHDFADKRGCGCCPNFLDVWSNLPFLIVGVLGFWTLFQGKAALIESKEAWLWSGFFAGVFLTGFGSSYYHWNPTNKTLFWDRLPMTIGFMSLLAIQVLERIDRSAGYWIAIPLLVFGTWSVIYWQNTEMAGRGDLRPYAFVQFFPLLAIPVMIWLFPASYTRTEDFLVGGGFYALAKVFEHFDKQIFRVLRFVSGHSLKHLSAALGTYWIYEMMRLREIAHP